jgi:hypothetical protein
MNFSDASRLNHASVQDICAGGYIHGILEEASVHLSTFTDNPGSLCEKVSAINRASCYHGIGHALMFAFDRDVEDSLTGCRTIQNSYDASRCFEGVWMERFWGKLTADDETITQDPLALCIATKKDSRPACFLYASFGYLRTHVKDYKGAIRFCTKNNLEHSDSEFCLKGVGITMNSAFKSKNLNATEQYVTNLDYWKKKAFYQGVFGYASLAGIPEKSLEDMCAAFKKDGELCREVIMESN